MDGITTNRATTDEKAKAWDRLMRSTGDDATAIQDAWEYLRNMVLTREDASEYIGAEGSLTPVVDS